MNQETPLKVIEKTFADSQERIRKYQMYYQEKIERLQKKCFDQTNATIDFINKKVSQNSGKPNELDGQMADQIIERIEEQIQLLALYQQQQSTLDQYRQSLQNRMNFAQKLERKIDAKWEERRSKGDMKQEKSQGKNEEISAQQDPNSEQEGDNKADTQKEEEGQRKRRRLMRQLKMKNHESDQEQGVEGRKIERTP